MCIFCDAYATSNSGQNSIYGTDDVDLLVGNSLANSILGQVGNDSLSGDERDDYIYVNQGDDSLLGESGFKSMIRFQEITNFTGISYSGLSYGASWGDFNGDIYPDLYVSNHANPGTNPGILYLNQGDGMFTDVTAEIFVEQLKKDSHGAAWADFDNDGDQDLIQLVGGGQGVGSGPNQMYVNNGGKLEDRAIEL